ncbi:MAG: HepT-like ribonuclease domain-containing protein [Thermofilaceae archaeon]
MTRVDREVFNRFMREALDALNEVKSIVSMDVDEFLADRRARYSLRYCIVVMVEALADLSVTILEKDFNDAAESYREAFFKLASHRVISLDTCNSMAKLASLRNQVVHRYWAIDDLRIYREAREGGIEAVERFIKEVEEYVEAKGS